MTDVIRLARVAIADAVGSWFGCDFQGFDFVLVTDGQVRGHVCGVISYK